MLQNKELLLHSKNLLAFSAGVDSTALFFLLLEANVKFDIAIVDYGVRKESKEEVSYAKELANKYNLRCHLLNANAIHSNFEANAREIRYSFFQELVDSYKYENLLTAHHLGDRFEWMLMQFCKGAGCVELAGMKAIDKRQNYTVVRPLLHLDKQELLSYLHTHNIMYFEDKSNLDEKYKRNAFRHQHTKPLLEQYLSGIKKSFKYIDADVNSLVHDITIHKCNQLAYFKTESSKRSNITAIDKYLKENAHLCTAHEKKLLQEQNAVVLGRKYIVNQREDYTFIAPFLKATDMQKDLKEKLRLLQIEPKLRGYLASDDEAVALLSLLLA